MTEINDELGKKIKELRESRKYTLQQMANRLGIYYQTLGRYERGEANIPAHIIYEYAKAFHVTPNYLYYGKEFSDNEFYQALKELGPKQRNAVKAVLASYK